MIPCQGTTQAAGRPQFRPSPGRDPGPSRSRAGPGFCEARAADCRTRSATRTPCGGGAARGTAVDGRAGWTHRVHDAHATQTAQRNHSATSASLVTELNIIRMLALTSNCSATNVKHNRHAEQRACGPTAAGGVWSGACFKHALCYFRDYSETMWLHSNCCQKMIS